MTDHPLWSRSTSSARGRSDRSAWDTQRYSSLDGHAQDVAQLCRELDLREVVFVGHSVSAMIGVLAARLEPQRFAKLVLVTPSPRYIDDGDYRGGFSRADIDELLESLSDNYLGWSATMAPVIMGNPERPELGEELTSFCQMDPHVGQVFARATFLSDNRADLAKVEVPTLVLHCAQDVIAPPEVGAYVRPPVHAARRHHRQDQHNARGVARATPRGPRRAPQARGPAHRRRPDLLRDAHRAAAEHAELGR